MKLSHYLHFPRFHFDSGKDLNYIYAMRFFTDLALKAVWFFLPIFLFQFGYKSQIEWLQFVGPMQRGFVVVAGYYAVIRLATIASMLPFASIYYRTSDVVVLTISLLMLAMSMVVIAVQGLSIATLLVSAIFLGMYITSYFLSYHTMLVKFMHRSNMGEDLGLVQVLIQIGNMLGPAIGAVIIAGLGYNVLFLSGVAIVFVAILLGLQIEKHHIHERVTFQKIKKIFNERNFQLQSLSAVGRFFHDGIMTLWPLYIYLLLGSVESVGFLYSLSFLLALAMSFFMGLYIDSTKSDRSYLGSGGALASVWLIRPLMSTPWGLAVVDAADKLIGNYHWLFYEAVTYKNGKGRHAVTYFAGREIAISLGALVFWLLVMLLFIFTPDFWFGVFALGSVGVLLSLALNNQPVFESSKK